MVIFSQPKGYSMDLEALNKLQKIATRPWFIVVCILGFLLGASVLGNIYQAIAVSSNGTEVNIIADTKGSTNSDISQIKG